MAEGDPRRGTRRTLTGDMPPWQARRQMAMIYARGLEAATQDRLRLARSVEQSRTREWLGMVADDLETRLHQVRNAIADLDEEPDGDGNEIVTPYAVTGRYTTTKRRAPSPRPHRETGGGTQASKSSGGSASKRASSTRKSRSR